MVAAVIDVGRVFAVARIAQRAEQLVAQDFRETDHRVQRGAQFVAHIGQEVGLGAAGGLGAVLGLVELDLGHLARGDVGQGADGPVYPLRATQPGAAVIDPADDAIIPMNPVFAGEALIDAGQMCLPGMPVAWQIFLMDAFQPVRPGHHGLVAEDARHLPEARGDEQHVALALNPFIDPLIRAGEQQRVPFLTAPQGLFGQLALGDVGGAADQPDHAAAVGIDIGPRIDAQPAHRSHRVDDAEFVGGRMAFHDALPALAQHADILRMGMMAPPDVRHLVGQRDKGLATQRSRVPFQIGGAIRVDAVGIDHVGGEFRDHPVAVFARVTQGLVALAPGNVAANPAIACDGAGLITDRHARGLDPIALPVRSQEGIFEILERLPAVHMGLHPPGEVGVGVDRGQQIVAITAQQRFLGPVALDERAGQPAEFQIGIGLGHVGFPEPVGAALGEILEAFLACLQLLLNPVALRDVGVDGHEAAAGQGRVLDFQNRAIRSPAGEGSRFHFPGAGHARGHELIDIAGPMLAAFGIQAHKLLERVADGEPVRRQVQQFQEPPVEADDAHVAIDDGDAFGHMVKGRAQHRGIAVRHGLRARAVGDVRTDAAIAGEPALGVEARIAAGPDEMPFALRIDIQEIEIPERLVRIGCCQLALPERQVEGGVQHLEDGAAIDLLRRQAQHLQPAAGDHREAMCRVGLVDPVRDNIQEVAQPVLHRLQLVAQQGVLARQLIQMCQRVYRHRLRHTTTLSPNLWHMPGEPRLYPESYMKERIEEIS